MLSDEQIGKFVAEIFGEDRFHSAPGKYQLFARSIEHATRDSTLEEIAKVLDPTPEYQALARSIRKLKSQPDRTPL